MCVLAKSAMVGFGCDGDGERGDDDSMVHVKSGEGRRVYKKTKYIGEKVWR